MFTILATDHSPAQYCDKRVCLSVCLYVCMYVCMSTGIVLMQQQLRWATVPEQSGPKSVELLWGSWAPSNTTSPGPRPPYQMVS